MNCNEKLYLCANELISFKYEARRVEWSKADFGFPNLSRWHKLFRNSLESLTL